MAEGRGGQLLRAAAIAPVTVVCWLLPPTLYGVIYALFIGTSSSDGWAERLVEASIYWGYLGFLIVPLIAYGLCLQRFGSALLGLLAALLSMALYFPASLGAIVLILMVDSGGVLNFS